MQVPGPKRRLDTHGFEFATPILEGFRRVRMCRCAARPCKSVRICAVRALLFRAAMERALPAPSRPFEFVKTITPALGRIEEVNKELWLILSMFGVALLLNHLLVSQRMVLSFYALPTLLPPTSTADATPRSRRLPAC